MSGPPPSDDDFVPEEAGKQAAEQIIQQHPLAYLLGWKALLCPSPTATTAGR
jgi:hypothetical protein